LWTKTFDTIAWGSSTIPIIRIDSGGFALAGVVYDAISATNNILLKRFDEDGNFI
jgi:hypothetical protein